MKRIFFTFVVSFVLSLPTLYAQNFIQTVDGKCYWTDDEIEPGKEVVGKQGLKITRIQTSEVVLVENIEFGYEVLQPDKLSLAAPVTFSGRVEDFCAAGKKVYVPVSSKTVQQRWGAKRLSENLLGDSYWQIVGSAEQADFLVEYVFDSRGSDKAYLRLTDRTGKMICRTRSLSARDWSAEDAGKESSDKLYEEYLKGEFYENNLRHWSPSDWTLNEKVFVNVGVRVFSDINLDPDNSALYNNELCYCPAVDALFSYRINSFAFGFGLEYQARVRRSGVEMSSLSPYAHATYYFNHWNPTFFRLRIGVPIPLKNCERENDWESEKHSSSIPWFMVSYGCQWKNLSLEFIAGLRAEKQIKEIKSSFVRIIPRINAGLELTYKIPLMRR